MSRERYSDLNKRLLDGRAAGTLSESDEDALLDEMDAAWWSMSRAEMDAWTGDDATEGGR